MSYENQSMRAPSSDAELIARAQRGEETAFEALYHAHKLRVYRLCLRMVGNTAEAEELTQEAFLRLFKKIHTFRGDSAFSTWLHRLSLNVVLMRLRKKAVIQTPLETDNPDEPQREYGAPDLTQAGTVDRLCIERAVAQLPPGRRKVFMLHDVLGLEHHEIATVLECSIGNSKSQLHKARMLLRKLLGTRLRPSGRLRKCSRTAGLMSCLGDTRPATLA